MRTTENVLEVLGWRAFFSQQVTPDEAQRSHPVRVMAVHRGQVTVMSSEGERSISPYIKGAQPINDHPTVGDWLLVDNHTLQPARVLKRMNLFRRRAPGNPRQEQMIAANIDTLFVVASCNQDFSVARLERYLVMTREVGVAPVVVLTKLDLTDTPDRFAAAVRAIEPGLRVEVVNGKNPASTACLAAYCGKGETVALLGSSGVGKSTLINTLRGSTSIATQAIRAGDDTGRHTTTVREMHRLEHGGWLLDTPGMRELQLSEASVGIAEVFDDFVQAAQGCRFSNCAHLAEPNCAVREAVANGTFTAERLDRWRQLNADDLGSTKFRSRRRR